VKDWASCGNTLTTVGCETQPRQLEKVAFSSMGLRGLYYSRDVVSAVGAVAHTSLEEVMTTTINPESHAHQPHVTVNIIVNHIAVTLSKVRVTGLEIKEAAIAAGVPIDPAFKLSLEIKKGTWRIIGDHEATDVTENSVFRAVSSDVNS
jgi:hypothetical protein